MSIEDFPEDAKTASVVIYKLGGLEATILSLKEGQREILHGLSTQHNDMKVQQNLDRKRIEKVEKDVSEIKVTAAVIGSVVAVVWTGILAAIKYFLG